MVIFFIVSVLIAIASLINIVLLGKDDNKALYFAFSMYAFVISAFAALYAGINLF